ncbi:DUF72 domain-containing protein [Singulisphaera sp. PoT]|uniref:DUF72 domain-containing protein n=1 Tax=Singulisphaera sp. PoT TaxID=3411797 RepID=UPI003BF5802E
MGCAGWSIPKEHAAAFDKEGSHLERYARMLPAVEINSSFYRPHRPSTYAKWAEETPADFRFSAKVPREVTHTRRLVDADEPLGLFLDETAELGEKRGPLLVQLPPSLRFEPKVVDTFFASLRGRFDGLLACEPRHKTWFSPEAEELLASYEVARVAADPAVVPSAAEPGGWPGLLYFRLHGSPEMYYSPYEPEALEAMSKRLAEASTSTPCWCIFDNTALGAATVDALTVWDRLQASGRRARS